MLGDCVFVPRLCVAKMLAMYFLCNKVAIRGTIA